MFNNSIILFYFISLIHFVSIHFISGYDSSIYLVLFYFIGLKFIQMLVIIFFYSTTCQNLNSISHSKCIS